MPAIPPHDTPVVDKPWDAGAALGSLPTNNQRRWKSMFAWYDGSGSDADGDGLPDAKDAWKFPHHTEVGGPAVVSAVRNGLARLATADIPDADKAGVRNHLQRHLGAFNHQQGENSAPPRENLFRAAATHFELREAGDAATPTLAGHFAVFNDWTEINSLFEGRFMEQIAPGAFKKTINENRNNVKVLFQHGRDPQIGDKPLGPIEDLREDDTGVYYEVSLLDTSYNRDLMPGLKAGLYGASFRFQVVKEEIADSPGRSDSNPDGLPERRITELRLAEFGPVTFPAYASATAGLRSITDRFMLPDGERFALSNGGAADGHSDDDGSRAHDDDGAGPDHSAAIRLGLWLRDHQITKEARS